MTDRSTVIICNRCDVPVSIPDPSNDESRVQCPVCGADFGVWADVRSAMLARVHQPYRDRDSWRTELR